MKLLIVALCLAVGPNLFIRCEEDIAIPDGINVDGANDGLDDKAMETFNIEDALDELNIGGRGMKERYEENKLLKFGDDGQFIAGKNDVLGEGSFGKVYRAMDSKTGRYVAVKTESRTEGIPTLPTEGKNYEIIGKQRGIPRIYYSGISSDRQSHVLVMQLLGKSLANLQRDSCDRTFTPKTVYMIGIQLMYRIELIHRKRLVHRDIKPANMGIGSSGQLIYVYDLGLSRKYVDEDRRHISEGEIVRRGSGTPRYMSAYAHSHNVQSRRDDLESIGFMLMSFLRGNLPWDNSPGYDQPAYKSKMVKMKENLDFDMLCKGFAKELVTYFEYVRNLPFSKKPDYPYLRKLFRKALPEIGEKEDYKFEWPKSDRKC